MWNIMTCVSNFNGLKDKLKGAKLLENMLRMFC